MYSGVVGAMIVNCWLPLSVVLTKPQAARLAEGMISIRTASSLLGHLFTRSLTSLMFTNTFTNGMKTAPGEFSGGRFT